MDYISLSILTFVYLTSVVYHIYSIRKIREEIRENNIEKLIDAIFENDRFINKLNQAINNSEITRKLNMLITILCLEDEQLRKTSICK